MKTKRSLLSKYIPLAIALSLPACAGTLTEEEQTELWNARGSGSGGSPTGGTTTGGGPMIEMCVTASMKTCQTQGCHAPVPPSMEVSAGLNLENTTIIGNFKSLVGAANKGDPTVVNPCMAGAYKLIDPMNPMDSLIYTKAFPKEDTATTPPCGTRMPQIGAFTAADRTCILNWINSAIMLSK
jgi:hypothetical protein